MLKKGRPEHMLSPDWLSAVTEIVGRHTRLAYRHLGLNTCVHSSRVLYTVLRREGIRSEPTAVSVLALNAVSYQQLRQGLPMSGFIYYTGPDIAGIPKDTSVKVLSGEAWNAHMVVVIEPGPDADLVVADVTAPQFHRPQFGVHVGDSVTFDADPEEWRSGHPGGVELPGGGALVYRRLADDVPEAQAWKKSSAWTTEGNVIRAISEACLRDVAGLDQPRTISRAEA